MNIREHVLKAIYGGMDAERTQRDGVSGVLFQDGNEFIPFDDLNYNSTFGYYRLSQFPDIEQDCTNGNPETIHWGTEYDEDWKPLIWCDNGGNLTLLGDPCQLADMYQALGRFLLHGETDSEEISEYDPAWSHMRKIDWAILEYREYLSDSRPDAKIGNTIRAAASAGRIKGAKQDGTGSWYFYPASFRGWLIRTGQESRGRGIDALEELITGGGTPNSIQHELARMSREATGKIPRGQLWQPCEVPGCDNEPVCMNCMQCEETHCHCFD